MLVHFEESGIVIPESATKHSTTTHEEQRESLDAIRVIMHFMEHARNSDPFFRDKHTAMMRQFKFHIRRFECCDELKKILQSKYKQYNAY